jgi:phosphoribosylformimino-5-aminoimidazole carboxamide ribotide isomerase
VASSTEETVKSFEQAGAGYIHMVDLDGAKEGTTVNRDLFARLAKLTNVPIELGGGIRNMETVDMYLNIGISRVILGSAALRDREFLKRAVDKYGEKISVGIDAKGGKVSVAGWLDDSDKDYIEFAREMEKEGVKNIIFTDISKDGTLAGPNLEQLGALASSVKCDITASGGIHNMVDIENLCKMKLYGAITGRAIYDGTLDLVQAIELTKRG